MPISAYAAGLQPPLSGGPALDLHSVLDDGLLLDEALGALDRLSLLDFSQSSRTYSIHRLVQLAGRDIVGETVPAWVQCAVTVADAAFPEVNIGTWPQCERLLPHVRSALAALPDDAILFPAGRAARRCAEYLHARGEYEAAEPLAKRAVAILEKMVPADRQEIACALQGLASVYYSQGRYGEAEPLLKRALTLHEEVLASGIILSVATALNDLAILFHKLGRFSEEEPLYVRALAIQDERSVPMTLRSRQVSTTIRTSLLGKGATMRPKPMKARALAIREKALGPDHPDVAKSLNSFGHVYYLQKRYEECEGLLTRAFAIQESALGSNHPDVAYTLNNLAMVYLRERRYEGAEILDRARSRSAKNIGRDHFEVAIL